MSGWAPGRRGSLPVVELVGSEEMVGVGGGGAGEEFWPWANPAAAGEEEMCVGQRNEHPPGWVSSL